MQYWKSFIKSGDPATPDFIWRNCDPKVDGRSSIEVWDKKKWVTADVGQTAALGAHPFLGEPGARPITEHEALNFIGLGSHLNPPAVGQHDTVLRKRRAMRKQQAVKGRVTVTLELRDVNKKVIGKIVSQGMSPALLTGRARVCRDMRARVFTPKTRLNKMKALAIHDGEAWVRAMANEFRTPYLTATLIETD